jgi:hypothetical protein
MSDKIKVGGAVKDGEAPPPPDLRYIFKVDVSARVALVTVENKEAL